MVVKANRMEYPITCFLVDDDPEDQELFNMAVKDTECYTQCVFADNGLEAVNKLNSERSFVPDCIFIDINMPVMNGFDCLQKIKQMEHLSQVPVYMYSTCSNAASIARARELNATDYIIKPESIKTLTDILYQVFQQFSVHPAASQRL